LGIALAAVLLSLILYLIWQRSIQPLPYETLFEVRREDAVTVDRAADGALLVSWKAPLEPVTFRAGDHPERIDREMIIARANASGGSAAVTGLDASRRWYIEITTSDGDTFLTGERVLPLRGAVNFRDLGGYPTDNGGRVKWGRVYRADGLNALTDKDIAYLERLEIRQVCDLRSFREVEDRPDRLPQGAAFAHIPIFDKDPFGVWRVLFLRHRLREEFTKLYTIHIVDRGADRMGETLRLLADPANLPLVLHCTGGKDRTGVVSALILHICGVAERQIVNDYSLTNLAAPRFIRGIKKEFSATRMPPGLKIEQLYPLLAAQPAMLEATLEHVRASCGSIHAYLIGPCGLSDAEIAAIRGNLVEMPPA
jgi:protein-tyrosine phosphatase